MVSVLMYWVGVLSSGISKHSTTPLLEEPLDFLTHGRIIGRLQTEYIDVKTILLFDLIFHVGDFSCGNNQFVASGTPFGPPTFPDSITANNPTGNKCSWWTIAGDSGTRAQLRIFYFDIPESDGCSQTSLKIHNSAVSRPETLFQTLCGELSEYVFVSTGNSMSVVLDIGSRTGYRGFHAVFETAN